MPHFGRTFRQAGSFSPGRTGTTARAPRTGTRPRRALLKAAMGLGTQPRGHERLRLLHAAIVADDATRGGLGKEPGDRCGAKEPSTEAGPPRRYVELGQHGHVTANGVVLHLAPVIRCVPGPPPRAAPTNRVGTSHSVHPPHHPQSGVDVTHFAQNAPACSQRVLGLAGSFCRTSAS